MILDVHITCVLIISHSFKTLRTENNKKHDFACDKIADGAVTSTKWLKSQF